MLAACGGGGGDGGGGGGGGAGGGGTSAPPVASSSNLLPVASALGVTLFAEAATLRPLVDRSQLTYRGVTNADGRQVSYTNLVQQLAEGGGVRESQTNQFNQGDDSGIPVLIQGGTVKSLDSLQLVEGAVPEAFEFIELRSPVRINDRYVMLDKRIADSGGDFDGDRLNDPVDVALWADVVGTEVLDLPNRRAVTAVRVDTRLRSRVQYTSDKTFSPVIDVTVSTWYAPGLGVVKTRLDAPGDSPQSARVTAEESLVRWDAGDRGLGYSTSVAQTAVGGGIEGGTFLPIPLDAVAFESHAVVMTHIPGLPMAAGFALSRLDMRGQTVSTAVYRYAALPGLTGGAANPRLLRVGNSLRVLLAGESGVHMFGFDATGQQLTSLAPVTLTLDELYSPSGGRLFQAASVGDRLWLAWMDYPREENGEHRSTVRLQAFGADGAAVASPQTVEPAVHPGGISDVSLQASAMGAVISYAIAANPARHWYYAGADASSGRLITGRVLEPLSQPDLCGSTLVPLLLDTVSLLGCTAWQQGTGIISLNADMTPMTTGGSIRVDGWLNSDWRSNQGPPTAAIDGSRVVILTRQYAKLWPEDVIETGFVQIGEADATNMVAPRLLARFTNEIAPMFTLGMGNRVLIVGADNESQGGRLMTMLVWR